MLNYHFLTSAVFVILEAGFGPSEEKIEIDEEGGGWDVDDDDLELPPDLVSCQNRPNILLVS